jgi:hypothetical protein
MRVSEGGVQIGQTRKPAAMPQELRVQAKTNEPRPSATTAPGAVVNPAVLKREIRSRFRLLKDCPREVARNRRVALDAISASRLTLRWTILPGGQVADTQVVATAPTDGRVMNCVKREMSQWSFSAPSGGAVRVERDFSFRAPAAVTVPREKP